MLKSQSLDAAVQVMMGVQVHLEMPSAYFLLPEHYVNEQRPPCIGHLLNFFNAVWSGGLTQLASNIHVKSF